MYVTKCNKCETALRKMVVEQGDVIEVYVEPCPTCSQDIQSYAHAFDDGFAIGDKVGYEIGYKDGRRR